MNYENKHRIESLAKAACPNNKKVSIIFRSKENKLSDRPNAFIVTVGKKGYTSVRQSNYWAVELLGSRHSQLLQRLLRPGARPDIEHDNQRPRAPPILRLSGC